MTSTSLMEWRTDAWAAFDEIENAHRAVGGVKPGRRFLTQQLNYAYTTLLAARFQGFARALHTQTANAIARGTHNAIYRELMAENLTHGRILERHNAQPDSIKQDFARFGLDIWTEVGSERIGNDERRKKLGALVTWRNAIAHDDINVKLARSALEPRTISLGTCRNWRSALNVLATSFDKVAADHCQTLGLPRPW
jgi:hypothetical protein